MASTLTSGTPTPADLGTPTSRRPAEGARETLDWETFSARYFPGRHRHDFEAIAAYAAYRQAPDTLPVASPRQPETSA